MDSPAAIDINSLPLKNVEEVSSTYCNNANVAITPWDIRLIFSEIIVYGKPGDIVNMLRANIAMNPAHAKALASALSNAVAQYEKQFGPVTVPEQRTQPSSDAGGVKRG